MSHKRQIFKINTLNRLLNDENSCVSLVPTTRLLALPPFFLNDMKSGIFYILNSMLKKYDRALDGIVIGYQKIKILLDENTGIIPIGTSETEVNISVEFYIFQPKIGNFLEGVVNKKSSNHIGCLVHQYFNATILKPEEVFYEDWICKNFNVDDRIVFKVKDLDFTSVLPYIEGVIDEGASLNDVLKKCDKDNVMFSECSVKDFNFGGDVSKEGDESIRTLVENVNETSEETESLVGVKNKKLKKKKKEKIKEAVNNYNKAVQDKFSNSEDTHEINFSESNLESHFEKKKKKKKKKGHKENSKEVPTADIRARELAEQDETQRLAFSILEKYRAQIEDENSNDFIKPIKSKKDKKKKKSKEEENHLQPTASQCVISKEPEFSTLFRTSRESNPSKKMNVQFCSPMSVRSQETTTTYDLTPNKRKKHKKRSREEPKEVFSAKQLKNFSLVSTNKEVESETIMEMCNQQLNKVKKELKISDKEKKRKKEKRKRETEEQVNGTEETDRETSEKNFELQNTLDELLRQELNRVKEELKEEPKTERRKSKPKATLYDKLLNQAMCELGSEKKKKRKLDEKVKTERYQNGSMYNVTDTPEKANFDKSLFTDSENSHASPAKRSKEVNGFEGGALESLNFSDVLKKKNGSEKRNEKKKKSISRTQPEESLLDKLLNEVKCSLKFSPLKKKK